MNIKDFAKAYEPQRMGNIADLEKVETKTEIKSETRKDQSGEEYHVMFVLVEGKEYRVPASVVEQLKTILAELPDLQYFKVNKTGQDKATKYQVIPL